MPLTNIAWDLFGQPDSLAKHTCEEPVGKLVLSPWQLIPSEWLCVVVVLRTSELTVKRFRVTAPIKIDS